MKFLKTIAWVIGINKYDHYNDLCAAVNDAKEFAANLRLLGYDVIESIDDGGNKEGTYDKILDKQQMFLNKINAENPDVALLYFAGHGCMINGEDCLITSDAESSENGSIKSRGKSIVLNTLCKYMNANGVQMNILIIDACRVSADGCVFRLIPVH